MARNFSGQTSDVITQSTAAMTQNTTTLITGWWYPTSLTSTNVLWAYTVSGNNRVQIDTTTTQLRLISSNSSTNAQYTASLIPITTNTWWFFAFLYCRSTNTEGIRVWQGTENSPPLPMTVTNTVAGNNNYSSVLTFGIGNAALGTTSWAGDIDSITQVYQGTVSTAGPLPTQTAGTITNNEADAIYNRWVFPLWNGTAELNAFSPIPLTGNLVTQYISTIMDDPNGVYSYMSRKNATNSGNGFNTLSVTGTTFSQRRAPRPNRKNASQMYERINR